MAGGPDALLGHKMASDGGGMRHLNAPFRAPAGVKALGEGEQASGLGSYANVFMAGGEVFKFAVRAVPTVCPAPDSVIVAVQGASMAFCRAEKNRIGHVRPCASGEGTRQLGHALPADFIPGVGLPPLLLVVSDNRTRLVKMELLRQYGLVCSSKSAVHEQRVSLQGEAAA